MREKIPADAVCVGAAGSLPGDLQRMWTSDERYSYNMEYGYSCMGYEIAGALGSKLAQPEREVYAMCGDGSYLMLHSELVTSIQDQISQQFPLLVSVTKLRGQIPYTVGHLQIVDTAKTAVEKARKY